MAQTDVRLKQNSSSLLTKSDIFKRPDFLTFPFPLTLQMCIYAYNLENLVSGIASVAQACSDQNVAVHNEREILS